VLPHFALNSGFLSWEQMRTLRAQGAYFGSHSDSHPDLRTLDAEALREELEGSRKEIEKEVGQQVTAFSYPMGAYNKEVMEQLRTYGYRTACTLAGGYRQYRGELLALRRIWVTYDMSLEDFQDRLPWP
jgi:peptidoglycan/xylan/chitin deacetylase (PgdA/CDA1 family)